MSHPIPTQRQFLALAVPNILAGLTIPIASLIDIAFLGHLDSITPMAGVALSTLIFDVLFWSFGFLRMSTTGLTAKALGAGDTQEQEHIFWRAMLVALVAGVALTALQWPIGQFAFWLLQGEAAVEIAGYNYYSARIWGAVPWLGSTAIMGWLLGQQRSKDVMWLLFFFSVWFVGLDYLFVVKLGMEAFGAGLATAIADWLGFGFGLLLVYRHWGLWPRFSKACIFARDAFLSMMHLNLNIMIRTFLLVISMALFLNISAGISTTTLTANSIIFHIFVFCALLVDGYAIALESLCGKYAGQGNMPALKRSIRMAMRWNLASSLACVLLLVGMGGAILRLLTEHREIIDTALFYLPYFYVALVIGGFAFVYDGLFLGLGEGALLRNSMLLSVLCFLPFAFWGHMEGSNHLLWVGIIILQTMRVFTLWLKARKL